MDGATRTPPRLAALEMELDTRRTLMFVLGTSLALALVSIAAAAVDHLLGGAIDGPRDLIDLNREGSLPTLWSSLQLTSVSALALVGAARARRTEDGDRRWWLLLAALALALALDESLALHEHLSDVVRDALGVGGLLHYAWVVPGGVAALVVGLAFLRFVRRLPDPTRTLLAAGAGLIALGGFGMELIGGAAQESGASALVVALYHVEETLELVGEGLIVAGLVLDLAPLRLGVDA